MRINISGGSNTLYYILKDHLGSASVVTDSTGAIVSGSDQRYHPYGESRLTGTMLTDKLVTGQRDVGLGIYHYGARFYSPRIGRFISPDTIVPGYANPQNLNRFSYVRNNPVRYTDPTGHMIPCEPGDLCRHPPRPQPPPPPPLGPDPDPDPDPIPDPNPGCVGCSLPASYQNNDYYQLLASSLYTIPSPDTLEWCDIFGTDCILSAASLVATVVAAVPGTIGVVGLVIDVVATFWAIGRTNDDYRQGEISKTRQYALNITGIVGILPGGLLGEWAFPVSFVAGLANLLMTASGLPN